MSILASHSTFTVLNSTFIQTVNASRRKRHGQGRRQRRQVVVAVPLGKISQSSFVAPDRFLTRLQHLGSYPAVSDGIETFKSNPYGAKSLDIANATYAKFGEPIVPHLKGPYAYVKPYVEKADSLADAGLGKVDSTFPIVKEDTHTLIDTAKSYAFFPFALAGNGRDYLFSTWDDEYNKTAKANNRGPGISTSIMAIISTQLKIVSDAAHVVGDYLGPKKEEAKAKRDSFIDTASQKTSAYTEEAKKKKDGYTEEAKKKTDGYAEEAKKKKDQAQTKASS